MAEIQGQGRRLCRASRRDPGRCAEEMVKPAVDHFGRLDVVFANAGIGGGEVVDMEPADWDRRDRNQSARGVFDLQSPRFPR